MTTTARRIGPLSIYRIERRTLSTNGNPRFTLHTSWGEFQTQDDASLSYGIENYTNSRHEDTYCIGTDHDVPEVTLITTAAGKVWAIELNGEMLR